jgi:hypothetical protein
MKKVLGILGLAALVTVAPAMARVDFKPIAGGEFVVPMDFTADASEMVASGFFGAPYFTWTMQDGLTEIGGGCDAGQVSIAPDGSMITGTAPDADGFCEAAKWIGGQDWQVMGSEPGAVPCGSSLSSSWDNNGTTAVGLFWRAQVCRAVGGTWDLASGTAGPALETIVPDRATRGNGITDDGSIIVGWQDAEDGSRLASRWIGGVHEFIVDAAGHYYGEVTGTNSNGSVMWGAAYQYDGTGRAWLYRNGEFLPMGVGGVGRNVQSSVSGATEDGSVAVGVATDFDLFKRDGWIWQAKKGFQKFSDFLKGQSANGWTELLPAAISRDGRFIAGWGTNPDGTPQAFIVDLKATGKP